MAPLRAFSAGALLLALLVALPSGTGRAQEGPSPADLLDALLAAFLDFPPRDAAQLQAEVAEIGGVPFLAPVVVEYLAPDELPARLTELFDAEFPAEGIARDARVLAAFSLLPAGFDLRARRLQLMIENVVGFYDDRPGRQRLYVVAAEPRLTPSAQMIAVHELRHALQDQHAPTHHALAESIGGFDDRRLAYMSVLEGDAIVVMEQFLRRRQRGGEERDLSGLMPAGELPGVPPVLATQLVAPYAAGRPFVHALQRERGGAGVKALWTRPPRSTEQVLHPAKFLSGEEPAPLPPLRWTPPGATVVAEGVLGEMLVRTLLGEGGEAPAAGWGGDSYRLWQAAGGDVLLWRSTWDTEKDRAEFAAAARRSFAARHGAATALGGCDVYGAGPVRWAWCAGRAEERLVAAPAEALAGLLDDLGRVRAQ